MDPCKVTVITENDLGDMKICTDVTVLHNSVRNLGKK